MRLTTRKRLYFVRQDKKETPEMKLFIEANFIRPLKKPQLEKLTQKATNIRLITREIVIYKARKKGNLNSFYVVVILVFISL